MDAYKLLAKRIGLVGLTNLLVSFSGIILLPILTKNIPVQDYGIWAQIVITLGLVPEFVMLGLQRAMHRFVPSIKTKENLQELVYSFLIFVLFTSLTISILIYIFSGIIASALFDNQILIVKILSIIVLIESLNAFLKNYFRATQQVKIHSILQFTKTSLKIFFVVLFVLNNGGIIGAISGLLISSSLVFFITILTVIYQINIKIPSFINIKKYLKYGLPLIPGSLSKWIIDASDRYLIGFFLGTTFVGYYNPGYALGDILKIFFIPLNFMLPMVLSKHYDEHEIDEVKNLLSYTSKYFFAVTIPSVFGLSLLSKPILRILSTPDIASQAYIITPFVALSILLYGTFEIFKKVILLEKKTKIDAKIWVIAAILNLVLNIILIPLIGIIAAALTTLLSFTISLVIVSYYSLKILKFNMNFKFILKSILASIIMSLLIFILNPSGILNLIFTICVCAISYFVILILLNGFDKKELKFFKNLINPKI
ncbi:multi antimicrobial extrusion protein MatE (plasmid) [Methanohalobium evestigatum Z-7303]|uniref:Multi antimicrobial extrusion protein MatE n=1 Tax=Methanohalobium evestigatum (strain ATCC BAA-1072 / DSM 3721 / NBRC 107634 / OCM 161 / Z-7303) TaxID=644295 RepID=D7EBY5_METEZ|nr:polysaccharide biosynthesis C-terminal domain-containing protein [Methanohalobium evestigatum]ADI75107.1 multi antimicrobial extrusion protein MatE [Methanohalobium evestigatum Z-7303]